MFTEVFLNYNCIGIRGRMGYNPIKVSQAYYCEDSFLNQLGINPAFYASLFFDKTNIDQSM